VCQNQRDFFCNKKVKDADGNKKRASDFCTSCGCSEKKKTGPTPTPPANGCKGDDVKIKLKDKGKKSCAKIKENSFCNKMVKKTDENRARASDLCTICGCGGNGEGGDIVLRQWWQMCRYKR